MIQVERTALENWLAKRAEEITGTENSPPATQKALFVDEAGSSSPQATPAWQSISDPAQRLAAFHLDRDQPSSARFEAEGVLRIHEQRIKLLDSMGDLRPPEIIPLGVLMLMPESPRAV